jgi:hypothetical protein
VILALTHDGSRSLASRSNERPPYGRQRDDDTGSRDQGLKSLAMIVRHAGEGRKRVETR